MGEMFYRTLYDSAYFDELQRRSLYWFDHEVLSKCKGILYTQFLLYKLYTFKHGITSPTILYSLLDPVEGDNHGMCHMMCRQ